MTTRPSRSNLLIISPAWVGDMVMAQSLFKFLKREQFSTQIDVIVPAWAEGLFKRMPEVRDIIPHTLKHGQLGWRERYRLGQQLCNRNYQQAIVLPNSWKSALIPFWADILQRTGYRGEMRYGLLNDLRILDLFQLPTTVLQFIALGLPKSMLNTGGLPNLIPLYPKLSPGNADLPLRRLHLKKSSQPLLILCPGAEFGGAKRWPAEYYAIVAKKQLAEGWQVWILGSEKEAILGMKINALAGDDCSNLCGQTSLSEAIDLMSQAEVVISNDSGLMHIAAALEKPLIALYGASSPQKTPPLSSQAHVIWLQLACSPCFKRECPLKKLSCLRDIKPEQVLNQLKQMI